MSTRLPLGDNPERCVHPLKSAGFGVGTSTPAPGTTRHCLYHEGCLAGCIFIRRTGEAFILDLSQVDEGVRSTVEEVVFGFDTLLPQERSALHEAPNADIYVCIQQPERGDVAAGCVAEVERRVHTRWAERFESESPGRLIAAEVTMFGQALDRLAEPETSKATLHTSIPLERFLQAEATGALDRVADPRLVEPTRKLYSQILAYGGPVTWSRADPESGGYRFAEYLASKS